MRREHCANCHRSDLDIVLDLGSSALANDFPTTAQDSLNRPRYPLQLLHCPFCGLTQLGEIVEDKLLWERDYAFCSSSSPALVAYHANYAQWLLDRYRSSLPGELVVEVACNDGSLLRHVAAAGVARTVVGVDPAATPVADARALGLTVWQEQFTPATADRLVEAYAPASLVVANNVLAHVEHPVQFLKAIHRLLAPDGAAVVEVQYLPDLLLGNEYPHIYHEHRCFLSLQSLAGLARRAGLHVCDAWLTEPQGGSLRVELRRQPARMFTNRVGGIYQGEDWLLHRSALAGLQGRADRLRHKLLDLVAGLGAKTSLAGYGASAKATTLLAWTGLAERLTWVVDTTPSKTGRYLPGTSLPVLPDVGQHPDVYLLLVWNYLRHVLRAEAGWLHDGGRIIVPVPVPVLL